MPDCVCVFYTSSIPRRPKKLSIRRDQLNSELDDDDDDDVDLVCLSVSPAELGASAETWTM